MDVKDIVFILFLIGKGDLVFHFFHGIVVGEVCFREYGMQIIYYSKETGKILDFVIILETPVHLEFVRVEHSGFVMDDLFLGPGFFTAETKTDLVMVAG